MFYIRTGKDGRIEASLSVPEGYGGEPDDGMFPIDDPDLENPLWEYRYVDGRFVHDPEPSPAADAEARYHDAMSALPRFAEIMANRVNIPDGLALELAPIFPVWDGATTYEAGFRVTHEGVLYRCLQAHAAQPDWAPEAAPSLWARVLVPDPDVIPEWEQPGSTNPYMRGDRVRFGGEVYESAMDGNVWSPEGHPAGWKLVSGR